MNYGNLVRRPFQIVIRNRYLWLLGFLAGGGAGLNYSSGGSNFGQAGHRGPTWAQLQNVWNDNWAWMAGVLAAVAVACIVMFVLGSIAAGGLIQAAVKHDAGHDYALGTAWRTGYATGWRIAGLRLLVLLLALVPAALVGALALAAVAGFGSSAGAGVGFGLMAALVFVAAAVFWLALSVAFELAQRLIVLEDGHVAQSLTNGFRMLRWHFREIAIGWVILIGLSIAAGVAAAILLVVVAVPAGALAFGGWAIGGTAGAIILGSFAGVFALGVFLAASGAYAAYSSVYWTLLFTGVRALPAPVARGAVIPAA